MIGKLKIYNFNNILINYTLYGEKGIPLIFFSGIPFDKKDFSKICDYLSNNNYKCIVIERNFGDNIIDNNRANTIIQLYNEIITKEFNNEKVNIIAYSIGSYYAIKYLQKYNSEINKILLITPLIFSRILKNKKILKINFKNKIIKPFIKIIIEFIFRIFLIKMFKKSFYPYKIPGEKIKEIINRFGNFNLIKEYILDKNEFIKNKIEIEQIENINNKIYIIIAEYDKIVNCEKQIEILQKNNLNIEVIKILNSGHSLISSNFNELIDIILKIFYYAENL